MNAIVPASTAATALVRFPTPAPASPPPPPPPGGPKGSPFASVYADVMQRADEMLPDRIVHVADLRMTPHGHVTVPGGQTLRMNEWARKQLASLLGLRWDTWFKSASGEERAEEVNRRFSRIPGEKKLRAWKDPDREADGIIRAGRDRPRSACLI